MDVALARLIAGVSLWSSRHAKSVLAIVVAVTAVLGYGVTKITTDVDVADVLPRGDPNTEAAQALTREFRSTFTQQVTLQLHVDEEGSAWARDHAKLLHRGVGPPGLVGAPPDPGNITDEVYVRATAELVDFIAAHTEFERAITISNLYALINWTLAGGEDGATEGDFALPGYRSQEDARRYQAVDTTVKAAILSSVDAISSPKWDHAAALFMPAADNPKHMRVLGEQMLQARDAWLEAVAANQTEFTVFGPANPPLFTVDLPVANARSSQLVEEDLTLLMPLIAAFIVASLFVAFRNVRAIAVSLATLVTGTVWTYGIMGHMGIALNTINMTIVPLIMGIGIDYAIHIINEFAEHKAEGLTDEEAFRVAGSRSGLAMFIASLTTIAGLVVLAFSPSLMISQLGLLASIALAVIYLLAIAFIPAALTLVRGSEQMGRRFKPSRTMPAIARTVSRLRWVAIPVVAALSVLAFAGTSQLEREAFGDPGRNYLPSEPIRKEHERGLQGFYGVEESDVKANILTFQGPGVLTPQAIAYYRAIEANLKTKERVIDDTLRTVPFFIETWLTVKGGGACAIGRVASEDLPAPVRDLLGQPASPCSEEIGFPETEEEIREEVNAMFASPFRELASIIANHPNLNMAAMTFSVRAATYEEAEAVWFQVWGAVEEANRQFGGQPPEGVRVAFVGNTATNYLFIAKELPWLTYMNVASNAILGILVFALTRSLKVTGVTLAISTLTTLWWFAVLPQVGIGLAITLTLPIAFIIAIGTDYAVHFMWNIRQTRDPAHVFRTTGKAVLFSFLTTTGAFAIFIGLQNLAVRRTMIATTIAFGVIVVVTMLMVPSFFPIRKEPAADRQPMSKEAADGRH